jgi:HPt (histidine-containing phosphotransfer) domain-containing protein
MRDPRPTADHLKILDPQGEFRDRLEADRAAIAQLSESGDLKNLEGLVHGLAGAAGTFGFSGVGEVALELDERFRAGEPVTAMDIARLLAALEQALGEPEKSV